MIILKAPNHVIIKAEVTATGVLRTQQVIAAPGRITDKIKSSGILKIDMYKNIYSNLIYSLLNTVPVAPFLYYQVTVNYIDKPTARMVTTTSTIQ